MVYVERIMHCCSCATYARQIQIHLVEWKYDFISAALKAARQSDSKHLLIKISIGLRRLPSGHVVLYSSIRAGHTGGPWFDIGQLTLDITIRGTSGSHKDNATRCAALELGDSLIRIFNLNA